MIGFRYLSNGHKIKFNCLVQPNLIYLCTRWTDIIISNFSIFAIVEPTQPNLPKTEKSRPNPTHGQLCGLYCRADQRLVGELFVLNTGGRTLKRPLAVQLSHHCVDRQVANVGVLWRPNGSTFWQSPETSPVRRLVMRCV